MMWLELITSFFYLGKFPKAPGTMGTLGAIPLAYALTFAGDIIYLVVTLLICVVGIVAAQKYESIKGEHDSKEIVIDEVAGYLITMALLPVTWQAFVLGFVAFRVLDILKPFPIGWIDKKVSGGVGVMADDIVAGIVANAVLHVVYTYTSILGEQFIY